MAIRVVNFKKDYRLSPHFLLSEFRCKDGSKTIKYSEETISLLEKIFDTCTNVLKIVIESGYRNPTYSVKVGGSKTDAHTVGIACDVKVYDKDNKLIAPKYVACVAQDLGFTGIGIMKNSIHLDTRTTKNYKNGKWWGDETNGKNGITDFYSYSKLSRSEVDKVLGRMSEKEPDRTKKLEREIERLNAELDSLSKILKEKVEVLSEENNVLKAEAEKYKEIVGKIMELLKGG